MKSPLEIIFAGDDRSRAVEPVTDFKVPPPTAVSRSAVVPPPGHETAATTFCIG